ncbi:MAG: hypothetical protein R3277_02420 [Brumimicrobium sp.]|nr:hypothetical protein [Brumimicrobium sp.]
MRELVVLFGLILMIGCSNGQTSPEAVILEFNKASVAEDQAKAKSLLSEDAYKVLTRYEDDIWKGIFTNVEPYDSVFTASQTDSTAAVFCYKDTTVIQNHVILEDGSWKVTFPIMTGNVYSHKGLVEIDGVIYSKNSRYALYNQNTQLYAMIGVDYEMIKSGNNTMSREELIQNMVGKECITFAGNVEKDQKDEVASSLRSDKEAKGKPTLKGTVEHVYQSDDRFGDPIYRVTGRTSDGKGFMFEIEL